MFADVEIALLQETTYCILQTIRRTFFLKKLPSKFRCVLYSKLILKCPVFDLKFLSDLKMAICSMSRETYLIWQHWIQLAAAVHRCNEHELRGFTSLLTLSPSRPAITNPEHCRAYVASLQSTVPVNLNWKWFVLSVTVQYFC